MSVTKQLFTEKFRPKKLSDLIAPPRVKDELDKGLFQNLLLTGTQGTGKTSTAFIMAQDHTYLYINASSDGRIETLRERISNFCSTISLIGGKEKLKCVILDEGDGASEEFFKALRGVLERYANVARFIMTCNYIQKIPEPIQSRFNVVSFDPIDEEEETYLIGEYKKRVKVIMKAAKIEHSDEILEKFVRNKFPDMRSLMNMIQSFYLRGVKELNSKNYNINFDFKDLFDLCVSKPNPYENYKFIVSQYGTKINDTLSALGSDFPDYLKSNHPKLMNKLPMIIITVAEYQYQKSFVIDPLITLLACVLKIQTIMNQ
jgi:replication factor C small subunit